MEKKILATMAALVVVAVVVVAAVTVSVGAGPRGAGGFTALFDKLQNSDVNVTHNQQLMLPSNWKAGDKITVTDTIVDMWYQWTMVGQTHVYTTSLIFTYLGQKWNNPQRGTDFNVPQNIPFSPWLEVRHGSFEIDVSSATNLTARYHIGDSITLTTMLSQNGNAMMAFGEWQVVNTL